MILYISLEAITHHSKCAELRDADRMLLHRGELGVLGWRRTEWNVFDLVLHSVPGEQAHLGANRDVETGDV